ARNALQRRCSDSQATRVGTFEASGLLPQGPHSPWDVCVRATEYLRSASSEIADLNKAAEAQSIPDWKSWQVSSDMMADINAVRTAFLSQAEAIERQRSYHEFENWTRECCTIAKLGSAANNESEPNQLRNNRPRDVEADVVNWHTAEFAAYSSVQGAV